MVTLGSETAVRLSHERIGVRGPLRVASAGLAGTAGAAFELEPAVPATLTAAAAPAAMATTTPAATVAQRRYLRSFADLKDNEH